MNDEHSISVKNPEFNPLAKDYELLRSEYQERKQNQNAQKQLSPGSLVSYHGIPEGKDAYNPSGPFVWEGEIYMWARVESRAAQDAVGVLFKQSAPFTYELVGDVQPLPLEDPFTAQIGNELSVGGVEITKDEHDRVIGYHTIFYKGESLQSLHPFATGPSGMKDIRLGEITTKEGKEEILVFTRPHIPVQSRFMGRIAMTTISSFAELTAERLAVEFTDILPDMFANTEWGGVNDFYVFPNGLVGVLCHIAKFDEKGKRHYAAAAFVIEPVSKECSQLEMIAERGDFPMGPVKVMPENLDNPEMQDDLADVIFSSRLTPLGGETVFSAPTLLLTCGLSDAATGMLPILNPFPRLMASYFPTYELTKAQI